MDYAEASYPFPGTKPHHFQHIAARDERRRLDHIEEAGRKALAMRNRTR